jgi:hypothetical protein
MDDTMDHQQVQAVIQDYCDGIYTGNVALLRKAFDPRAALFGEVGGEVSHRPLDVYLDAVAARQSPQSLGEPFLMKTLGVEVRHRMACATVHCPILGHNYYDTLSLLRENGQWRIVNKTFTDQPR